MSQFQESLVKIPVIIAVIFGLISGAGAICTDDECNFELTLNYRFSMSCYGETGWLPAELNNDREPFLAENTFHARNTSRIFDPSSCIFGSGTKAGVIEINGQYPAAPIQVTEGALVHVKVNNNLFGAVAPTLHWHGFKMSNGYYWYDGVVGVTQCGIESKSSFTYSFIASEVGIRWFHGHSSGVKLDGLYGAVIVHPKDRVESTHVIVVSDSMTSSVNGATSALKLASNVFMGGSAEINVNENNKVKSFEGIELNAAAIDSTLINGRFSRPDNSIPYHRFDVTQSQNFSIVSAASEYPLEIEINDHFVILYELDGYPVDTIKARRLYLQPGETAKIGLEKMNDDSNDLFLLRLSLPGNTLNSRDKSVRAEQYDSYAIIEYGTSAAKVSTTFNRANWNADESSNDPAASDDIMNNPYFSAETKQITASPDLFKDSDYYPSENDQVFKLHLNTNFAFGPSIDGRKFRAPKSPYSTNGQPEITPCDEGAVWCTNTRKIPLNSIVELSITSFNTFAGGNFYHLFHIHGMEFYVMATGHGEYPLTLNSAFRCVGDGGLGCSTTERVGNVTIPMNFENPVKRTSVTIPNNGFAIVRFKADNPGMWLFHCHTFTHLMEGQAILLDVTDQGVPPVPPNFPTCPVHEVSSISNELIQLKSIGDSKTENGQSFPILTLSILILSLLL